MPDPVIEASALSISYRIGNRWLNAVSDIDLAIYPQQIHGLVGESGSGKSTLGLGMMGYLPSNARITHGSIRFGDEDLVQLPINRLRSIWGRHISFVPQNPLDALNPTMPIGKQMVETTKLHLGLDRQSAVQTAIEALASAKIADPERILGQYPHQLSGGMQQRVMIAMALSTRPKLLVLDEPTTALDVTTQAAILDLIRDLIREEQAAALFVSHDLGIVAQICDHVTVLYSGEVMENASVQELFTRPLHPYTRGLLNSLPQSNSNRSARLEAIKGVAPALSERLIACVFADRCPIAVDKCSSAKPPLTSFGPGRAGACWRWDETSWNQPDKKAQHIEVAEISEPGKLPKIFAALNISKRFGEQTLLDRVTRRSNRSVQAVRNVSLSITSGTTVGLVGESGSGKTTLARAIVALTSADSGELMLLGKPLSLSLKHRDKASLAQLRMVFQNPNDTLNPYHTVGHTLARTHSILTHGRLRKQAVGEVVTEVLIAVGLSAAYVDRLPGQLSGGEKQRVALARALIARPALIIADEATSSLDVSVQANILNLLKDLRAKHQVSYLVISHDLDVISYLADWVIVMYLGEVMEQGPVEHFSSVPVHPYTEALLSAIPAPDPTHNKRYIRLEGEIPSPRNRPAGCPFHARCPRYRGKICATEIPPLQTQMDGHQILCHIPLNELERLQKLPPAQEKV